MRAPKSITIVGGGLAGLTLGIGLRRLGISVSIWESGHYPRHRVCGEFISGNGSVVLERLGLRELFKNAGAIEASTAQFIAGQNRSPVRELPERAVCLSRYAMDDLLAKEFQRLGGDLRENMRWNSSETGGVVHAGGRRPRAVERGWRWFGLKIHARGIALAADLEMHISQSGYVGVNRINDDEVNVCGLFRARPGEVQPESRFARLRGEPGSALRDRLASAEFDECSFCAVAGLSLEPQSAAEKEIVCIGDALTMIPPVTGNGMSMAFESAEIALEPLAAFSHGEMSWPEARKKIASGCDAAFAQRLTWARRLQSLMFSPLLRSRAGAVLLNSEMLWRLMFTKTR